ncbi:MAG: DNA polymerase III subunit delta [Alphaproteobacteria bacterium]|nr:DNA polymerase III subunit delta [Alphaproteobacteria bacterium]
MKLAGPAIARFLARPDPAFRAILIYGPDAGLVRERAETLCRTAVPDLADPFRVAELTGAALAGDPARLADEAAALALTGGRRVVRVRAAGEESVRAFEAFLVEPAGEALVVVEAGDLGPRSKLRGAFEAAEAGAALPCYVEEGATLEAFIRDTLAKDGLVPTADALALLVASLGADRLLCRRELEKLALYKGAPGEVAVEDVAEIVGDSGALTEDDIAFACADGDPVALDRALARAFQEGAQPVAVVRAALRHFTRLHLVAGAIAAGQGIDRAMRGLRPPVFFRRVGPFRAALGLWPAPRLERALARLNEAEIACKSTGLPAETMCAQALFEIALAARARRRA